MTTTARRVLLSSLALALVLVLAAPAAGQGRDYIRAHYTKQLQQIRMRDGIKLATIVYTPKDTSRRYPVMLTRTPYSVESYEPDEYPDRLGPSEPFAREGFIFAYQDVRGRFLSQGTFVDLRPHRPDKRGRLDIDESTDTWDTVEWLVKNAAHNNGRVGMWGISYDGFYAAAGMIDAHPALVAVSPQAPIGDCYFGDDCYHNGVLWLPHNFGFYTIFQERTGGPAPPHEAPRFDWGTSNGYEYFLRMGAVGNSKRLLHPPNVYWNNIVEHTTYDEFWKARSITRFFRALPPAVLTVGGWFDAEDLPGPLRVFQAVEKLVGENNHLVMGPWSHGGWAGGSGEALGNLEFGSKTSDYYREQIEFPFFLRHLKAESHTPAAVQRASTQNTSSPAAMALPKAFVFQTGSNRWRKLDEWPPRQATPVAFFLAARGRLLTGKAAEREGFDEYESDPARPVPFVNYPTLGMPADYMTEDQRFTARRPDVLVYATEPLEDDLQVAGPIEVNLFVSTTGTDSDFVVKVIDAYPGGDESAGAGTAAAARGAAPRGPEAPAAKMAGYQQLVRGEPFRGKYRNSFEKPEPFERGRMANIRFTMPDVCHTFLKGHRLMVHVQSSWFPLGDRNPQTFTDIPNASPSAFRKATQRVYRSATAASAITLPVER